MLGICNGFQILCEARLLPGVLRRTGSSSSCAGTSTFASRARSAPFTAALRRGRGARDPVKHGEGNWYGDAELVAELEARGQVVLRYTEDVNGAVGRVAGVSNEAGNVLGLMPHPEHAVDPLLGPVGGRAVLGGLIAAAAGTGLAVTA